MSDTETTINRRVLLGQLAYSLAGAVILGGTMNKCMRDEWMAVSMDMVKATSDNLPEGISDQQIEENLHDYYEQNLRPTANKLTTALGGLIGYASSDFVSKPAPEPDVY